MKTLSLVLVAVFAVQTYGGHHHHHMTSGKEVLPVTSPHAIEEGERATTCPHGFRKAGKQCVQQVTAKPTVHCPPGTVRTVEDSDVCTKFFDKVYQCPPDFNREKESCARTVKTDALVECPSGFTLMSHGRECSRAIPLPNKLFCPHGTRQRGDSCVQRVAVPHELTCPPGFTLQDKTCHIVEEFDCTPSRISSGKEVESHKHHKHRRLGAHDKKHHTVHSKEIMPTKKEFVSHQLCKHVRTEGARKSCPKGARLLGKECFVEEEVSFLEKSGGFREEIVKAHFLCPEGSYPSSTIGFTTCLVREEVQVHGFCPNESEDIGNKCVKTRPTLFRCPEGYSLEDDLCVKSVFAPPVVEFTVNFRCTGKDCDHSHAVSHKKH